MLDGKLLSCGDCLVLINSIITKIPIFMLSFHEIPKGVWKRLDSFRSHFFWQSNAHKIKYCLTKWNIIFRPKYHGVLRVDVLDIKNKYAPNKWLFKLLGTWRIYKI
jgi:hypothetical protein